MQRMVWGLALTIGLSGCQLVPTLAGNGQAPGGGATAREFPETIQGLSFRDLSSNGQKLISSGGANLVSSNGGSLVSAANAPKAASAAVGAESAPMAPQAGVVSADAMVAPVGKIAARPAPAPGGGAYSGNVWGGLGYGYYGYFGGSGEQMALISAQEAELPGSKGGLQEIVNNLASPILKNWASDARLVQSNATLGSDGLIADGSDPNVTIGSPVAMVKPAIMPAPDRMGISPAVEEGGMWSLTYVSTRRNEVLQFHVRRSKTTVIRLRWAPLHLQPERVQVDSAAAIKRLTQAITDKAFQGVEERTRKDYFSNQPFEQPQTGQWDGDYQRTEVVYAVPGKARWNVSLEQNLGKLVWQLNFYSSEGSDRMVPMMGNAVAVAESTTAVSSGDAAVASGSIPAVCEPSRKPDSEWNEGWFNNSGSGMVDAQTGEVIRFSRPTRAFYRNSGGEAIPAVDCRPPVENQPAPLPSAVPGAAPEGNSSGANSQ